MAGGKWSEVAFTLPHRGCYFPTWAHGRPGKARFTTDDIDPSLCTYIVVAFGAINGGELCTAEHSDEETFRQLLKYKQANPTLKVLLSVGGWTASNQVAEVSASAASRRTFVLSAIKNLRKWGLDGLDVDWEFPRSENKDQFSALLTELRAGFEVEKQQRNQQRLALTAAVHLLTFDGYDPQVINRTCDIVHVMSYDFHGAWDPKKLGHHAPLFKGPFGEDSLRNLEDLVKSWEEAGVAKHKIIVGLPLYGRGWNLSSHSACELGGEGSGPVCASRYTGEEGNWPYFEIVERLKADGIVPTFDASTCSTYAVGSNYWIGFDDTKSIKAKTAWVKAQGYGGVFVWEISQDDFQNLAGEGRFPLLTAIRDILSGKMSVPVPQNASATGNFHVVQSGDTAYNIATKYGMTLDRLRNLNIGKNNLELLHPGDKLVIDGASTSAPTPNVAVAAGKKQHVVLAGDTAYNIAGKYGLTLDQLRKLNPGKGTMEMIHPGDKLIVETVGRPDSDSGVTTGTASSVYTVVSGDTAYNIATKHGMTLDQLRKLNPGKGTMEMIHPGDKLVLGSGQSSNLTNPTGTSGKVHVVVPGDTAYEIALKHGMTLSELRQLNPGRGTMEMIHPGDKLVVRSSNAAQSAVSGGNAAGSAYYTVQSGDTAYNIATKHGITLDNFRKLNPGKGTMEMIHPGDKLVISSTHQPGALVAGVSLPGNAGGTYHMVVSGDTAYNIATKYGMTLDSLRKLNPGKGTMEMIHPGDKLIIVGNTGVHQTSDPAVASGSTSAESHTARSGDTAYNIATQEQHLTN